MTPLPVPVQAALAALVVIAAAGDIRKREISNWVTLGGIAAGFVLNIIVSGWAGLKLAGLGVAVAALLFLPIFFLRWLGGGDVKLMGAIGALAGYQNLLVIFILDSIFGGVIALAAILFRGRLKKTIRNIGRMLRFQRDEELEAGNPKSMGLPRAVTIALATLLVLWASRP